MFTSLPGFRPPAGQRHLRLARCPDDGLQRRLPARVACRDCRPALVASRSKDDKTYRKLRKHGAGKEKAARIANPAAGSSRKKVASKGGRSGSYDDWSKADLIKRAQEIGIKGRSAMKKSDLIAARRHLGQVSDRRAKFRCRRFKGPGESFPTLYPSQA
jgi:hypothetical protein